MSRSKKEEQYYQEYLKTVARTQDQTAFVPTESKEQKEKRKKHLLAHPLEFIKYYFAHYIDSGFAWFHEELVDVATKNKKVFCIAELPREHAKSVFIDVFLPLYLKAKGELTGMILASSTFDKAQKLLSGIQAELAGNQLYINDFGVQTNGAEWQKGQFVARGDIGFWAFGRGQSPRGVRVGKNRPNYGAIDDIDDKVIVNNISRVVTAVDWVLEDFLGALSIKASRLFIAGNRIHPKSILAHLVGDVEEGEPKRAGITHIKAYAIENPTTREKAGLETGQPAWSRYSIEELKQRIEEMGYTASRREYFHEHIEKGLIFKNEWIQWGEILNFKEYDSIVTYCDPSFMNTKTSDYKAIVTVGKIGKFYHVLHVWLRQASIHAMVTAFYDIFETFGNFSSYWMETNMLQSLLVDEFEKEADERGEALPLRKDKSKKPSKDTRIEGLSPLFERLLFVFDKSLRSNPDMKMFINQLLGFGGSGHDDGPDALEGAVAKLNKKTKKKNFKPRLGHYTKTKERRHAKVYRKK